MNEKIKLIAAILTAIIAISGMIFMFAITMNSFSAPKPGLLGNINVKYNVQHLDYNNESVEQFVISSYNNRYYRISLKFADLDSNAKYMLFQHRTSLTKGFSLSFENVTEKVFGLEVFKEDFGLYKLTDDWYPMISFEVI